jgi:hypothetical protein
MIISLSRYIRENVDTMEMNMLNVRMGPAFPTPFRPIKRMTSEGSACPLEACPKMRISMMVITMVNKMTVEAPKFLRSSL